MWLSPTSSDRSVARGVASAWNSTLSASECNPQRSRFTSTRLVHATDACAHPPIEVFRGVFANWWQQGADGIQTFNFDMALPDAAKLLGFKPRYWKTNLQAFREMGSPETLRYLDKTFILQRRGGGHGPSVVPNASSWRTPRAMYTLTNMFSPLPVQLDNSGTIDTLLFSYVAENLAAAGERLRAVTIRVLLSDFAVADLPAETRLQTYHYPGARPNQPVLGRMYNIAPQKGIERSIELRLNNALLRTAAIEDGWLVFSTRPKQFAVGQNLLSLRVVGRDQEAKPLTVELVEIHVDYE